MRLPFPRNVPSSAARPMSSACAAHPVPAAASLTGYVAIELMKAMLIALARLGKRARERGCYRNINGLRSVFKQTRRPREGGGRLQPYAKWPAAPAFAGAAVV